jgi:hypothetical protein
MRGQPVLAFHVITGPRKQKLAKPKVRDEDDSLPDFSGLEIDPFELIACVVANILERQGRSAA